MENLRRLPYVQLDVFTSHPLEGNQLAVFTDARGLSTEEMQALARETNLSETTFIIPRDKALQREHGVQVRIFTTQEELLFAGHPTLGTAYFLHRRDLVDFVELDLKVGKIPVRFLHNQDGSVHGEMTQRDPEFGQMHSAEDISRATGLPMDVFDRSLPIQTVSTGMAFVIVPLTGLAAMRELSFDQKRAAEYLEKTDGKFLYFVTRETANPKSVLHARMLFYNGEDPATGSAAGCCVSWAVRHGVLRSDQPGMIEQGLEMKRPSWIHIRATAAGDTVRNVRVGGEVVEVMRGDAYL